MKDTKKKAQELKEKFGADAINVCNEIIIAFENELLDLFDIARNCPINHKHSKYWTDVKNILKQT